MANTTTSNSNGCTKIIGLKNIHIAPVTKNDISGYEVGTPVYLAPAITAKITAKSDTTNFYGDDTLQASISSLSEVTVELDLGSLDLDKIAMLYGQKIDNNGLLVDNSNDNGGNVAIGFQNKMANGQYQFTWIYCCNFAGESNEYDTIQDKIKGVNPTCKGTAVPRLDTGDWRVRCQEGLMIKSGLTTPQSIISAWFTNVVEPNFSNTSIAQPTTPVANNTVTQA